ncbi:MAG: iron-only hydrogenase system regulator [Alphaproteobacteria bacterium]|nr:iron-only hydrogenase system regulator [Alphaproteobacteria bacterium]MBQ7285404.1 iron-only hydrogenase system regulator [Alphaproteobacteria bacterium]
MDTRVAIIGIIVENYNSVDTLNDILHEYRSVIIGRMGIPYRSKNISVMSIAVDADADTINALSGKIGKLNGVSAKTAISGSN